jgi:hypothetical protein
LTVLTKKWVLKNEEEDVMYNRAAKLGFYSAVVASIATIGYFIVQLLQLIGLLVFPRDAVLISVFSLCIAPPFMLTLLALYYSVPDKRKIWSHAALLFGLMYTSLAIFVYVVQLAVVIPKTLRGEADAIRVIVFTEHSFFWSLAALAYVCMGLSTLFASFVFYNSGLESWIKWTLFANALLTPVVALVYFYRDFSSNLIMLAFPWGITAPASIILMAVFFSRKMNNVATNSTHKLKVLHMVTPQSNHAVG